MATIDDLVTLVPPPDAPVGADGDWQLVERKLGVQLPADFKVLVGRYGFGGFGDITLWTPFATYNGGPVDLLKHARLLLDGYQVMRKEFPEDFPYPLYPEPGGLLRWASTGDGDDLCWLTAGAPDGWPVLVWNIRRGAYRYDMGVVDLLHAYLSGQRVIEPLRRAPAVPWFDAYRARSEVYVALSDGDRPYADQLRILREVMAPTADRGSWDDGCGARQDHFKAIARDWLLTYENPGGHQIRIAFPPEDGDAACAAVHAAVKAMGCRVLTTTTVHGPSTWPGRATSGS